MRVTPYIFAIDNGDTLVEWVYEHARVGLWLDCSEAAESSWYIVTDKRLGRIMRSGYLARPFVWLLKRWLQWMKK